MDDNQEVEILRISKQMESEDGHILHREVSYLSDHQVLHRIGVDGDFGPGWECWRLWYTLDEVYEIAARKAKMGWTIEFNPDYSPLLREFKREVLFRS